jgi:hypothetical protein
MPAAFGAAASGISSLVGASNSSSAASAATQAAQQATTANNQVATNVYNTNTSNLQPFVNTGQSANSALAGLLGIGGNSAQANSAFQNYLGSTNYQFQLNQGLQGTEYANATDFDSGATAKALNNYAQGQAASALSGYEGELSGLSGTGVSAASSLGSLGTQYASQTASNNNNLANVTGGSAIYNANAQNNALSGLSGAIGQGLGSSSFNNAGSGLSSLAGLI